MEVKGIQREGSTLSHTPDKSQVLLIMVNVVGQRTDWVVPAGVSGQRRNSVASASQYPGPTGVHALREGGGFHVGEKMRLSTVTINTQRECYFTMKHKKIFWWHAITSSLHNTIC